MDNRLKQELDHWLTTPPEDDDMPMTEEQEQHLQGIKDQFEEDVDTAYRNGQAEHGGNLFDMSIIELIDNGIKEAVDQYVYFTTAKEKFLKMTSTYNAKNPPAGEPKV